MVALILEFTLFLLVLFVVLPAIMVAAMLMREAYYRNPKSFSWHRQKMVKPAG